MANLKKKSKYLKKYLKKCENWNEMILLDYLIHLVSFCNQTYSQICTTSQHVKSGYLNDFWIIHFCFEKKNCR